MRISDWSSDVCSSDLLRNEESGKFIRKYLYTRKDVDIEARMRVYNLIRDLTADAYGGWRFVVALQSGGGLPAQRTMMKRTFDLEKHQAAVRKVAGDRKRGVMGRGGNGRRKPDD